MRKPEVFVTRIIPDAGLDKVRALCHAEVWADRLPPPPDILMKKAARSEGLLCTLNDRVDAKLMEAAPRLRVISNFAVGFNNIDVATASELGIPVGNTPDVLTDATADMAFCLMMAAARRLMESHRSIRAGEWKTWEPLGHIGQDLVGRTLGVVGMGRIGYALARRCRGGWGMRILYYDLAPNPGAERELEAERVDFDTLLGESDFVSVHTVLNERTRGMFNKRAFTRMKSTAVFINTARGPIHVQRDLYNALKGKQIFAAGLDVTDPEPIPADDPLLTLPNAVIAPHIASATVQTRNAMAEIAADNLIAGLGGEPLRAYVNPEAEVNRRR
jgi:glyoxylate reductase